MDRPRWGLVATLKAPAVDILNFAAYHLELGADRLFLYLDAPDRALQAQLGAHPRIRVLHTDDAYWSRDGRKRPRKHQVRQSRNADHAYADAEGLDWLAHIDVDEFIWPDRSVAQALARQPTHRWVVRMRPHEALAPPSGEDSDPELIWFKGYVPADGARDRVSSRLYPGFGAFLKGGFLSHLQGKVFVRTGLRGMDLRIHNVFVDGVENPGIKDEGRLALLHLHANDWQKWRAAFAYRHARGSYRADLSPASGASGHAPNLHAVFARLVEERGEDGLRAFFDEVCTGTPRLRRELDALGLLRAHRLELERKRRIHFPAFDGTG